MGMGSYSAEVERLEEVAGVVRLVETKLLSRCGCTVDGKQPSGYGAHLVLLGRGLDGKTASRWQSDTFCAKHVCPCIYIM